MEQWAHEQTISCVPRMFRHRTPRTTLAHCIVFPACGWKDLDSTGVDTNANMYHQMNDAMKMSSARRCITEDEQRSHGAGESGEVDRQTKNSVPKG
ncbi:hypothetical protein CDAR_395191 [Caerostris darwini]|uniref:Uncharacterized protein n=1 Tax=Caerostris darwini TaxID=1538125 RepID=A0AAV4QB52_9ARAC|nr:hypothetical protein CDAR_395191 [Caerostris darwini]